MPVKIRLIATDIDGTLIRDSTPDLYPEIVEEIRRLTDGGVLFACASGRQYASIRNVFRDVADRILYIAENGAHIRYRNEDLSLTPMKPDDVRELIETLRGIENCEMVVSTPQGSLMETKNRAFLDLMTWGYHNEYRVVDDVLAEKLPILKVSIYRKDSIRELGESSLIPAYADRFPLDPGEHANRPDPPPPAGGLRRPGGTGRRAAPTGLHSGRPAAPVGPPGSPRLPPAWPDPFLRW